MTPFEKPMQKQRAYESQLVLIYLATTLPLFFLLLASMLFAAISYWLIALVLLVGSLVICWGAARIKQKVVYQLRTQTNLIEALASGDYTLRARATEHEQELAPLFNAINRLGVRLSQQRWQSVESQQLVQTILENIDIAILAVDSEQHIKLFNRAASKLFSLNESQIAKPLPSTLALIESLPEGQSQLIELPVQGVTRRFNLHTQQYMSDGQSYTLIFLNDVHALLRSEERLAWQRLVRVMSHEINNSLSPIASISQTLAKLVAKQTDLAIQANLVDNLTFIHERANNLGQFIEGYNQLARLPGPKLQPCALKKLLSECQRPFEHCQFTIIPKTDITLDIDPVQIEQLMINLFKNAYESAQSAERECEITLDWHIEQTQLRVSICDNGAGVGNSDNLFVPFYSTKKHGSGIGLVLCQQIAEAHSGRLTLQNRADSEGCCAQLTLPVRQ